MPAPKDEEREVNPWTEEEAAQFLECLEASRERKVYKVLFRLLLVTGMRFGEAQALR
ncbi:hypothetical protein [Ammonifex thiophilus]|uniref:hypothetical protein n=1 Tax=Ammonifex thiophilus TaxID=444093 RepID=UPI001F0C8655|nr:hypothetical protein [Ammonifex thiophilus]